jgi:hypothetical protein
VATMLIWFADRWWANHWKVNVWPTSKWDRGDEQRDRSGALRRHREQTEDCDEVIPQQAARRVGSR